MSRYPKTAHIDDTRVDVRRPPLVDVLDELTAAGNDFDRDDTGNAATLHLSPLAWPEPPLRRLDHPRARTDGGITKAARTVREPSATQWLGLGVAVVLAAAISVFVHPPSAQPRASIDTAATNRVAAPAPAAQAPAATAPAPLIITVGTPMIADAAPPSAGKPAAVVSKPSAVRPSPAPPRPRHAPKPVVRAKATTQGAAAATQLASVSKRVAPSAEKVIDDGF
jgi:hypothetical protein